VAWGLVLLVGGAAGLLAMLICNYILSFGGKDSSGKHGISEVDATRLGGVAIVAYMLMHLGYQTYVGLLLPPLNEAVIIATCFIYFLIGVYEDLSGLLSARIRFALMLFLGLFTMYLAPDVVLSPVGIAWVDFIVGVSPLSAILFTALCVAFIPNAFNTADGANGLVAGTSALAFLALISVAPPNLVPFLLAAVVGCLVFLVFNLISGRFFLGDGGAYFLGALAGLSLVVVSNNTDVSVWWLLSLVFYPIADLIWSMGRRLRQGLSPLNPDNQHFHNLLFAYLSTGNTSPMRANNYTGLLVVAIFSGAPFLITILQILPSEDDGWFFLIVGQWVLYIIGSKYLNDRLCVMPTAKVRNVTT
jgi:UDP-N-acetylmuramyl pentapeptide phosphotransferase/UDP-N-acetylglucosamine-1-phosphate transferase